MVRTVTLILFVFFNFTAHAWVDADFDGVPDKKDACHDTPANSVVMANGCVDTELLIVDENAEDDSEFDHSELGATVTNNTALIAEQCRQQRDISVAVDCFGSIIQPVYFDFDKSEVLLTQRPTLMKIQQYIEQHPQVVIRLEGHTDNIGSDAVNKQLSLRRATIIKELLIKEYQFQPASIEVVGMSSNKPVADNTTIEGRRRNRRVEFIISAE